MQISTVCTVTFISELPYDVAASFLELLRVRYEHSLLGNHASSSQKSHRVRFSKVSVSLCLVAFQGLLYPGMQILV
jgi:hypothetical protein